MLQSHKCLPGAYGNGVRHDLAPLGGTYEILTLANATQLCGHNFELQGFLAAMHRPSLAFVL